MKIYFNINQSPALPFFGPHPKTHGVRGLGKNHHLRFDKKLGHGICAIHRIPCSCVACALIPGKTCIHSITSKKQARYQPVPNCTYLLVLGSFKNWNIIQMSHKSTPFETFEVIHQVVLDIISDNMALSVKHGNYCAINTAVTSTNE